MNFPAKNLSNQHISHSYQGLLQEYGEYVLNGLGDAVFTIGPRSGSDPVSLLQSGQTASMTVVSASHSVTSVYTDTASYAFFSEATETASYSHVAGVAENAVSASFVESASYATNSTSASYASTSAQATSASYVTSASYAQNSTFALSASYAPGSPSLSSSYSEFAATASYAPDYLKKTGDVATGDIIGTDFVKTRSGTITRDIDGNVSVVALTGGRTMTITRTSGYISSMTDGARTWTYTRDTSNLITSWAVT